MNLILSPAAKKLVVIAKYPIAIGVLLLVLRESDSAQIEEHVRSMQWYWLAAAFAAFNLAQFIAVLRMNGYYRWCGKPLDFAYSLKLHYVALFYNIVLPGGIGGDGYKVYLLNKRGEYAAAEGIKIQLLTRTNGLVVLLLSVLLLLPLLGLPVDDVLMMYGVAVCGASLLMIYTELMPRLVRFGGDYEWRALPYSVGVQGCNILSMVCLWYGLGATGGLIGYVLLFQLAALAGMIPITIGGLGVREFTFFYGVSLLSGAGVQHLDAEQGIVMALLMFAMTLASALIGIVWMGRIARMSPCAA